VDPTRSKSARDNTVRRAPILAALLLASSGCAIPAGESDPSEGVEETAEALSTAGAQYNLVNAGECLDIYGAFTVDVTPAITWSCADSPNQRFSLLLVPGTSGSYYLYAQHSQKCLDIEGGSVSPGARVIQYGCHGGINQVFRFESAGTDAWHLVAAGSGLCVTAGASGDVTQQPCSDAASQRWALVASLAPSVTLYRDEWAGPSLTVSGDVANLDLPGQSFTDMISSLAVSGGAVVSTYSGPNFTGACQSFRHDTYLPGAGGPVGDDNIGSLRFGAYCGTHQVQLVNRADHTAQIRLWRDGVWGTKSNVSVGATGTQGFDDGSSVWVEVWAYGLTGWFIACQGSVSPWSNAQITLGGTMWDPYCSSW
jgi:hypothetical protein